MTTTVHKNMTGADLHESKGVDTALSGTVYVANGAGSGSWTAASTVITNTAFTTGDLKHTHKTSADTGWILWVDGTIGDGSSGATVRANADTATLFGIYWNGYTNGLCPVSGGRGVSAAADYAAHKTITLPLGGGRVLGVATPSLNLGGTVGSTTATLSASNLPPHSHAGTTGTESNVHTHTYDKTVSSTANYQTGSGAPSFTTTPTQTGNDSAAHTHGFLTDTGPGTSTPFSIYQPTSFVNVMIKL